MPVFFKVVKVFKAKYSAEELKIRRALKRMDPLAKFYGRFELLERLIITVEIVLN